MSSVFAKCLGLTLLKRLPVAPVAPNKSDDQAREGFLIALGARVREARLHKKLSQRDLAIAAEYDEISVSKLENGQREAGVYALSRIARALGVPVGLLTGDAIAAHRESIEDLVDLTALATQVRSQAEWLVSLLAALRDHGIDVDSLPPPPGA
jgi:transcriptional regulator with XRE-family HTH domain